MNSFFYVGSYNPYVYAEKKRYRKSDYEYFVVDLNNNPTKKFKHHDLYLKQIQWIDL